MVRLLRLLGICLLIALWLSRFRIISDEVWGCSRLVSYPDMPSSPLPAMCFFLDSFFSSFALLHFVVGLEGSQRFPF